MTWTNMSTIVVHLVHRSFHSLIHVQKNCSKSNETSIYYIQHSKINFYLQVNVYLFPHMYISCEEYVYVCISCDCINKHVDLYFQEPQKKRKTFGLMWITIFVFLFLVFLTRVSHLPQIHPYWYKGFFWEIFLFFLSKRSNK